MDRDPSPKPAVDGARHLGTLICAVILTLAGLALAKSVMIPVAFALFIIALVWRLQRRLPQLLAVLITPPSPFLRSRSAAG
jgi:predicted PurR-regulated permease PerM